MQCTSLDEERVHHVGYRPDRWTWAPWEFAQGGRFTGRWVATRVYLEVLASFRGDPTLEADMDLIESDDE